MWSLHKQIIVFLFALSLSAVGVYLLLNETTYSSKYSVTVANKTPVKNKVILIPNATKQPVQVDISNASVKIKKSVYRVI